jgi:hypothetical protein
MNSHGSEDIDVTPCGLVDINGSEKCTVDLLRLSYASIRVLIRYRTSAHGIKLPPISSSRTAIGKQFGMSVTSQF